TRAAARAASASGSTTCPADPDRPTAFSKPWRPPSRRALPAPWSAHPTDSALVQIVSRSGLRVSRFSWLLRILRVVADHRSHEQLATVGERHVAAVGALRSIARFVTVDDDDGADRQRIAREAKAEQRVRRARLNPPVLSRAVRILDVDVNPRMRVDPLH